MLHKQGKAELDIMDVPALKRLASKYHAEYAVNKKKSLEKVPNRIQVLMKFLVIPKAFQFQLEHRPGLTESIGIRVTCLIASTVTPRRSGPTRRVRGRAIAMKDHSGRQTSPSSIQNQHGLQKRWSHRLNGKSHGLQLSATLRHRLLHPNITAKA